jgi:diguanylate cyclase (GGDEF)-like protein
MRMKALGRQDLFLFAGLTFALLVIFQRSLQHIFDAATEVEATYGVSLRPALLILTVMFVFHQYAKWREMKADAAAAAREARVARARAEELEQLMAFGQALSRGLTRDALREAVCRHLPTLASGPAVASGEDAWVVLRTESGWERLTDAACTHWPAGAIERAADHVSKCPQEIQVNHEGIEVDGQVCFAMLVGDRVAGVLGFPARSPKTVRQTIGAAAALLAVAVRNAQLFADVRDDSVKDALTGCYNRAHAMEVLESELARSSRSGQPMSIVLFDVDHFKNINDRHGHLCGDSVLAAVGQRIRQVLRRSDVRCRFGGDEFLIVLPETGDSGAARVAEWLRGEIEQIATAPSGERLPVTISAGTATALKGELQAIEIIERADRALYQAKAQGRNCVRAAADVQRANTPFDAPAPSESLVTH